LRALAVVDVLSQRSFEWDDLSGAASGTQLKKKENCYCLMNHIADTE
jgi:hypothetical protein